MFKNTIKRQQHLCTASFKLEIIFLLKYICRNSKTKWLNIAILSSFFKCPSRESATEFCTLFLFVIRRPHLSSVSKTKIICLWCGLKSWDTDPFWQLVCIDFAGSRANLQRAAGGQLANTGGLFQAGQATTTVSLTNKLNNCIML